MLSPRPQELDIDVMTDALCSNALLELYDTASKLCYENKGSGTCMVCSLRLCNTLRLLQL